MFIALDPHTAVVRVGDFFNNGKTQSGARRAESGFGRTVEAIENAFALCPLMSTMTNGASHNRVIT